MIKKVAGFFGDIFTNAFKIIFTYALVAVIVITAVGVLFKINLWKILF